MTKLQARFRAERPVDGEQLARVAALHSVYGIMRILAGAGRQDVTVEYDGTRLVRAQVQALLEGAGLAVTGQN